MDKKYITHIVLRGHLSNPVYKPISSNTDRKVFQNLRKLVDRYPSNLTKKEKKYVSSITLKAEDFISQLKHINITQFNRQYYKMIKTSS